MSATCSLIIINNTQLGILGIDDIKKIGDIQSSAREFVNLQLLSTSAFIKKKCREPSRN